MMGLRRQMSDTMVYKGIKIKIANKIVRITFSGKMFSLHINKGVPT